MIAIPCPLCGRKLKIKEADWFDFRDDTVSLTITVKHLCKEKK